MRTYDDVLINVELDEPSRSSPALGQIDRLLKQSAIETQSLQVVRRMLMRDALDRASVTGISKLQSAIELRRESRLELPPAAMNGHAVKKTRGKARTKRVPLKERMVTLAAYLTDHPGASTIQIGQALGWPSNMALKVASKVGTATRGTGKNMPMTWTMKGVTHTAKPAKAATVTAKAATRGIPREQRVEAIRRYLSAHPEAFTREIAKAVGMFPGSDFVKILRLVARPTRPPKGTRPINWVLQ